MLRTGGRPTPLLRVALAVVIAGAPLAHADWEVAPADAAKANPVRPDASSVETGRQLYVTNCLACHGAMGKGDGPAASAPVPGPPAHPRPRQRSRKCPHPWGLVPSRVMLQSTIRSFASAFSARERAGTHSAPSRADDDQALPEMWT